MPLFAATRRDMERFRALHWPSIPKTCRLFDRRSAVRLGVMRRVRRVSGMPSYFGSRPLTSPIPLTLPTGWWRHGGGRGGGGGGGAPSPPPRRRPHHHPSSLPRRHHPVRGVRGIGGVRVREGSERGEGMRRMVEAWSTLFGLVIEKSRLFLGWSLNKSAFFELVIEKLDFFWAGH